MKVGLTGRKGLWKVSSTLNLLSGKSDPSACEAKEVEVIVAALSNRDKVSFILLLDECFWTALLELYIEHLRDDDASKTDSGVTCHHRLSGNRGGLQSGGDQLHHNQALSRGEGFGAPNPRWGMAAFNEAIREVLHHHKRHFSFDNRFPRTFGSGQSVSIFKCEIDR